MKTNLNRYFSKEKVQMAKIYQKNIQYHLPSVKCNSKPQWDITSPQSERPNPKTQRDKKFWQGCREQGILTYCSWERKLVWRFLLQVEIDLPYDPAIPLPSIYNQQTWTYCVRHTWTTFIARPFMMQKLGINQGVHD